MEMEGTKPQTAQKVGQLIPQPPSKHEHHSDTDLPELTQEETEALILQARRNKRDRLAKEKYWAMVKAETTPIKQSQDELSETVLQRFYTNNGRKFEIDEDNSWLFNRLSRYFSGAAGALDLNKGIMLVGNVGVGKTEMMKLFTFNPHASYAFVNCRYIVDRFITGSDDEKAELIGDYSKLRKTSKPHPFNQEVAGICFDDLGTEETRAMSYGNVKNLMAEIILNRYDNRLPYKYTHMTTNLQKDGPDGIVSRYGSRTWDRIQQMFNIVEISQTWSRRIGAVNNS